MESATRMTGTMRSTTLRCSLILTKIFDGFIEECFLAKENCPLNTIKNKGFETALELRNYIDDFLQKLEEEPIPVYVNSSHYGAITRRNAVMSTIFPSLYKPAVSWPSLAKNLAELLKGNATLWFNTYPDSLWSKHIGDPTIFVMMNDNWKTGSSAPFHGIKQIQNYSFSVPEYSKLLSAHGRLLGFDFFDRAAWAFPTTHNFHPHYYPEFSRVKTAHPILMLSTTYDPVCPLISAKKARDSFEGAGLLEQKSYGHGSQSMASLCTAKHVHRYFKEGVLPETGAT
jgi:TAP-like protein